MFGFYFIFSVYLCCFHSIFWREQIRPTGCQVETKRCYVYGHKFFSQAQVLSCFRKFLTYKVYEIVSSVNFMRPTRRIVFFRDSGLKFFFSKLFPGFRVFLEVLDEKISHWVPKHALIIPVFLWKRISNGYELEW